MAALLQQRRIVPGGCQTTYSNVIATAHDYFAYSSTLGTYVYKLRGIGGGKRNAGLYSIFAAHTACITGLCFSYQTDPLLLATCGRDKKVYVYDVVKGLEIVGFSLASIPYSVTFDPHKHGRLVIGCASGRVLYASLFEEDLTLLGHRSVKEKIECTSLFTAQTQCEVVRFAPPSDNSKSSHFASGHENGTVYVYHFSSSSFEVIKAESGADGKRPSVVELRFDALSEGGRYLLVAYNTGRIGLWDVKNNQEYMSVQCDRGLTGFDWISWKAGNFVTTNGSGSVVERNVSQNEPLRTVRFVSGKTSVTKATFFPGKSRSFAFSCLDGRVGIYNMEKHVVEFMNVIAHQETIFDCQYKPNNATLLATASYDQHVKVFQTESMKCASVLGPHDGIVYCVSWAPGDDQRLAATTAIGSVFIWDAQKGKLLHKIRHHRAPAYRVDWNQLDPQNLASTSGDGYCFVFRPDGTVVKKYRHPAAVYGCSWSPFKRSWLATGCHDGTVRVYDTSDPKNDKAIIELEGHGLRVFNVAWNPLLPDVLASSSDDMTVRVWNTVDPSNPIVCEGHTSHTRALLWSTELPFLVISGSWDGTMKLWDSRSGECMETIVDHHSDVYGIACHPERPFVIASTSRDTTLRFWVLDGIVAPLRTKALLGCDWAGIIGNALECMKPGAPVRLTGRASAVVSRKFEGTGGARKAGRFSIENVDLVQYYSSVFDFFYFPDGQIKLWELAGDLKRRIEEESGDAAEAQAARINSREMLPSKLGRMGSKIFSRRATEFGKLGAKDRFGTTDLGFGARPSTGHHVTIPNEYMKHEVDLFRAAKAKALEIKDSCDRIKFVSRLRDEKLEKAALLFLQLGDLKQYCECMVSLGKYEAAIAVAPAVSMAYWKKLVGRYASRLERKQEMQALPFILASAAGVEESPRVAAASHVGKHFVQSRTRAVKFLNSHQRHQGALLAARAAMTQINDISEAMSSLSLSPPAKRSVRNASMGSNEAKEREDREYADSEASIGSPLGRGRSGTEDGSSAISTPQLTKELIEHMAQRELVNGHAVNGACCYFLVDDYRGAMRTLARGNELDLSYAIGICFNISPAGMHSTAMKIVRRCEKLGIAKDAIPTIKRLRNAPLELEMLCARCLHTCSAQEAEGIFHACGVKWEKDTGQKDSYENDDGLWGSSGGEGFNMRRARMLLLKRRHNELAKEGIAALRSAFSGSWDLIKGHQIIGILGNIACHALPIEMRSEILAYSALMGAQSAIERRLTPVVAPLLRTARVLIRNGLFDAKTFPASGALLGLQEAQYVLDSNEVESYSAFHLKTTLNMLAEALGVTQNTRLREAAKEVEVALTALLAEREVKDKRRATAVDSKEDDSDGDDDDDGERGTGKGGSASSYRYLLEVAARDNCGFHGLFPKNTTVTSSELLPSGRPLAMRFDSSHVSLFTKQPITGPRYLLEDGLHAVTLSEALMWAEVNPFSPLSTGFKIEPY